jgi:hypothetical protein
MTSHIPFPILSKRSPLSNNLTVLKAPIPLRYKKLL